MSQETIVIIRNEQDVVIPVVEQTIDKVSWISTSDKEKLDSIPVSGGFYTKSEIDALINEPSSIG